MRKLEWLAFVHLICCLFPVTAIASPILSLSSVDDLDHLTIGVPVTISVNLAGLEGGQSLTLLGGTVAFTGDAFSTPAVFSGAIVPDPLADPLDFLSSADIGLADASFFTFSMSATEQISQNGIFYSFTVVPAQAAAGDFALTFVTAGLFDPENPEIPAVIDVVTGPALLFQVTVPEPTSFLLATISGVLSLLATGIRKRAS